jgi:hypothetical protein
MKPPLALWLHPHAADERLPRATIRKLIEHYTSPGDLILTDTREQAVEARRLNRRARPIDTAPAGGNVSELPLPPARLAIVEDAASAAPSASLLTAHGFLALAVAPATRLQLGTLVLALQQEGLQYWQHIVIAVAPHTEARTTATRPRTMVELERVHRDVLVFRQPAAAAAIAAAGSVWAEVVAA